MCIRDRYREHGPKKTHLMQPSSARLSTGETECVYAMSNYKLNRASENSCDMEAMLKLAQAETALDVGTHAQTWKRVRMIFPGACFY
eukprot:3102625-Pyramimonas_sp.AAC.1